MLRRFVCLASAGLFAAGLCAAASCNSGSLASYIALGAGGCTIGTNTLFDFQTLSGTAGATEISTSALNLAPFGSSTSFGFTATTMQTASAGSLLETLFTYRISGNSYTGTSITLANSSEAGVGAVTAVQNYCAGGTFGPDGVSGCSGPTGALVAIDGFQQSDQASFAAVSLLSITDDFTLDGGPAGAGGSARGGSFTDQFTATAANFDVPEPASYLLTGAGLALAAGLLRRRLRAN